MNARLACVLGVIVVSSFMGCREAETLSEPLPSTGAGAAAPAAGSSAAGASAAGSTAAGSGGPSTGTAGGAAPASNAADYSKPENWLCRPGNSAACEVNLDTTVIAADGTLTPEPYAGTTNAPIDCFYVYPTISADTTPNSDLVAGPEEKGVVLAQFARFGSKCRLFAPIYRQVTLTALRAQLAGMPLMADRALGLSDVTAAWKHYLANDNQGRGVVLIGHSQGASVLTGLIKAELDKAPLDPKFISALLIGTTISVPPGAAVGGTFKNVPLCNAPGQLGCVVSYASFRSTLPPPAMSLFGRSMEPGMVGSCTNPAALGGGSAELHAYLSKAGSGLSSAPPKPWTTPEKPIDTPFVSVPGLLTGECVTIEGGAYLSVTVKGDPADPRVDDITGDVLANGEVNGSWGLHLIDMNVAMGNLLDVVGAQAAAHAR
jgi:hypothetical protein